MFGYHFGKESSTAEIRNTAKETGLFDTSRHKNISDTLLLEELNELPEMADLDPHDRIGPLGKFLLGLSFVRHGGYPESLLFCSLGELKGKIAAPCYETDLVHAFA